MVIVLAHNKSPAVHSLTRTWQMDLYDRGVSDLGLIELIVRVEDDDIRPAMLSSGGEIGYSMFPHLAIIGRNLLIAKGLDTFVECDEEGVGNLKVLVKVRSIRYKLRGKFRPLASLQLGRVRRLNVVQQGLDGNTQSDVRIHQEGESSCHVSR